MNSRMICCLFCGFLVLGQGGPAWAEQDEQVENSDPDKKAQPDCPKLKSLDPDAGLTGESEPSAPRYIIESVVIRGNDKTSATLIRSYLRFHAGETVEQEKVELSRISLLGLGYFKDVQMGLERGSQRGYVRVVVEVDERWSIIIDDLFFGVSETNSFWGGLGVSDINFMGTGMALSGAFVASEHQQAGRLGAFWPSVLGSQFSAGIQGLYTNGREKALLEKIPSSPCSFTSNQELNYIRAGGLFSFGSWLSKVHHLSFQFRVEHIEADAPEPVVSGTDTKCKNYPFLGYIRDGQSTLSSFAMRFERDTRDDFFLPTQGMHLVISIELASKVMLSDYEYSKYMLQYEQSFMLWLDHVLRLTVVGGLIQDVGERGSPFFTRFNIGDYALFQVDKTSLPRSLELNFSTVTDYGDLLGSIEAEYDIPIWSTGSFFYRGYAYAALNFSVLTKASFLASDEEWSGRTKRPVSFDFGLKFETPIGLFTLSMGYILDVAL